MALDLRPELASYGPPALTPNLQRLARRGGQFTFAYLAPRRYRARELRKRGKSEFIILMLKSRN